MTLSIEARDFPVSAKLRRSGDGSPAPPNSQAKLDTSSNQPEVYHWEHPRICCTCQYFYRDYSDPITPGCPACAMREHTRGEHHRACTLYSPKHTD